MDFTREPIIESVITPKEGSKLVIRSSKGSGQEEFFVDAVEVVSFGNTFFLRSTERPKSFLVPATDYEVLEVRETRMVLKNVGVDRSIKIGGGKEPSKKAPKQKKAPKKQAPELAEKVEAESPEDSDETKEPKVEKKRERRRHHRRRRGREDVVEGEESADNPDEKPQGEVRSLLPPPSSLISETIARYKDDQLFKDVFFPKGEKPTEEEPAFTGHEDEGNIPMVEPTEAPVAVEAPVEEVAEKSPES